AGTGSVTADSATVRGSGEDIWDTADGFHFAFQPWQGDGEIIARVESQDDTDGWAKAGVMFRETLSPSARNAFLFVTPRNGTAFQARPAPGATTTFTRGPGWGAAPFWVRLTRHGDL